MNGRRHRWIQGVVGAGVVATLGCSSPPSHEGATGGGGVAVSGSGSGSGGRGGSGMGAGGSGVSSNASAGGSGGSGGTGSIGGAGGEGGSGGTSGPGETTSVTSGAGGAGGAGGASTTVTTVSSTGASVCTSCAAQGKNCGALDDGCGHTLDCGSCGVGQVCGSGGIADVCAANAPCVAQVAAGGLSTCARKLDGSLSCWGDNTFGELGDGSTVSRLSPVKATAVGGGVARVATGSYMSCAIKTDGTLWCWGRNSSGQLGTGTTLDNPVPAPVSTLGASVVDVSLGGASCARKADGTLWCWGSNASGQVGDGTHFDRKAPMPITAVGSGVRAVSTGPDHTCAIKSDFTLWCWGENGLGQLGNGTTTDQPSPASVAGLGGNVVAVTAGLQFTCALKSDGTVWCWGAGGNGQLGDGILHGAQTSPVRVLEPGFFVGLAVGSHHACARKNDGTLWCWGWDAYGELGDGALATRLQPVQVAAVGSSVAEVTAGDLHTCARGVDGSLTCWGMASYGQLGYGASGSVTSADNPSFTCEPSPKTVAVACP